MNITDKQKAQAAELFKKHGFNKLFMNERGEFFSIENLAASSVSGDKAKYMQVDPISVNSSGKSSEAAAALIEQINTADTAEKVQMILDAELKSSKRKSVIDAANKKLETFKS